MLTAAISPIVVKSGYFRTYACFDTIGTLSVIVSNGSTTVTENLNGGSNLTAGSAYMFDIPCFADETINFQHSASSTGIINRFVVDEFGG